MLDLSLWMLSLPQEHQIRNSAIIAAGNTREITWDSIMSWISEQEREGRYTGVIKLIRKYNSSNLIPIDIYFDAGEIEE